MLTYKDIVKDNVKSLRNKSTLVEFPLSNEDLDTIDKMDEYLVNSYDEKMCSKYDIRPGVGIASSQIGINKRMFCIMAYDEKGDFHHYAFINPKIISTSLELTYLETGEGCLSVESEHKGYIHRPKKIKVKSFVFDFETNEFCEKVMTFSNLMSIIFQHEYDHLDGILFYDHIDKFNPFYVPDNSKPVIFKNNK